MKWALGSSTFEVLHSSARTGLSHVHRLQGQTLLTPWMAARFELHMLARRFDPPLQPSEYNRLPFLGDGLERRHLVPFSCRASAADARRSKCVAPPEISCE